MKLLRKDYIVIILVNFLIFMVTALAFISIEIYLYKKTGGTKTEPYGITFYTHDGKRISQNKGNLKLCLAPYTIYKNLPNQKTENFTINSSGFRYPREISSFNDKQKRIFVVGGSGAFGQDVGSDNETFHAMIEKMNNKYEVINAGVGGFHSGQELTYIVTELIDYNPDIIIAFDGWNDLFFTWYHHLWFGGPREKTEMGFNCSVFFGNVESRLVDNCKSRESISHSFVRFCNTVVDKSIIVKLFRKKIAKIKQKYHAVRSSGSKAYSDASKAVYFEDIINTYTRNLKKIHGFCQCQGIKFLVVFQPEVGLKSNITSQEHLTLKYWVIENYENEFPPLYKKFIERSKEILTKEGIPFIDINTQPEYRNSPKTLFVDVVHLNKNGNEVVAKIINQYLEKEHL